MFRAATRSIATATCGGREVLTDAHSAIRAAAAAAAAAIVVVVVWCGCGGEMNQHSRGRITEWRTSTATYQLTSSAAVTSLHTSS